jgi:hypothetical protein
VGKLRMSPCPTTQNVTASASTASRAWHPAGQLTSPPPRSHLESFIPLACANCISKLHTCSSRELLAFSSSRKPGYSLGDARGTR